MEKNNMLKTGAVAGKEGNFFITPKGRITFCSVFEPTINKMNPTAPPKYTVTIVFDKNETDLSALRKWMEKQIKAKYPGKLPAGFKIPIKDAEETGKAIQYPSYKNCLYFDAKANMNFKPEVRDELNKAITKESGDFYSGCYARLIISGFCYSTGSSGITFNLQAIQKVSDGPKLGSHIDIDQTFEPIIEGPNDSFAENTENLSTGQLNPFAM